ncbi:MAG: 2Fe-2S iron-sulfur cluster binding domain-containing protein [Planctomycetes bacterium]|nr:2Fe-2S iron-sulfur cluster binding domain-containing protein [Planctomycetota bacterium]
MGGENPYIDKVDVTLPTKPYRVRFFGAGGETTVEVDPQNLPSKFDGLTGSLLSLASSSGVKIDHACGGVCACSTCHVIVREGFESLNEASEDEEDMLDNAPGLEEFSRLACQAVPDGSVDLVVEVPSWNRNLVSEDH